MRGFFNSIAVWVFHLGGIGLFLVGIVDSSFLTAPLANDFLVIALTASHPHRMFFYALMSALGSTVGCLTVDFISRKAKEGIQHNFPSGRWKFVEGQFRKHAGWATVIAALVPPPFPFTPFVAAAAATGYPRKKLLAIIFAARLTRFTGEGALAVLYGEGILSIAKSPGVQYTVVALIVFAVAGSAFSVYRLVQSSRKSRSARRKKKAV